MVLLTIFPYSRPLLSRRVPGRSPNAWLEGSECCHMSKLAAASSKYAEQGHSNRELRGLAERVRSSGYLQGQRREGDSVISLPVSMSVGCQFERIFHPFVSATHAHRCRLILSESMENIPDCNGSHLVILTPRLPSLSAPQFPHRRHLEPIGGRVTPSHKALKGSQTH